MMTYPNQTVVSTRELAWGIVGENLTDQKMTAREALTRGGLLGWNVRKTPMVTMGKPGDRENGIVVPGKYATVRDSGTGAKILGVVGSRYTIHQNESTLELLETLVDEGGAHFDAVGFFGDGQRTFAVMTLPETIQVGGEDSHGMYLCAANSHDGTSKLEVWLTAVRFTCTNMLTPSMKGAPQRWGLRHTSSIEGQVQEAREALTLTHKWAETFETYGDVLVQSPFSSAEFAKMVERFAPESDSEKAGWAARQEERRAALNFLFHEAPTQAFGRGTRWAAYNAFTEYADWFQPVKGDDPDGSRRAARQLESVAAINFKQNAWEYLLAA